MSLESSVKTRTQKQGHKICFPNILKILLPVAIIVFPWSPQFRSTIVWQIQQCFQFSVLFFHKNPIIPGNRLPLAECI